MLWFFWCMQAHHSFGGIERCSLLRNDAVINPQAKGGIPNFLSNSCRPKQLFLEIANFPLISQNKWTTDTFTKTNTCQSWKAAWFVVSRRAKWLQTSCLSLSSPCRPTEDKLMCLTTNQPELTVIKSHKWFGWLPPNATTNIHGGCFSAMSSINAFG